ARGAIEAARDENPARYTLDIPEDLELNIDSGLVRRALLQLLENARKYSPPDSPIEMEARSADARIRISVKDRGPGIPQDELKRVFEKFYRGRHGSTGNVEGTGMGLAITK